MQKNFSQIRTEMELHHLLMEKNFIDEETFEEADYDIPSDICRIKPSEIEQDALYERDANGLGNPRIYHNLFYEPSIRTKLETRSERDDTWQNRTILYSTTKKREKHR